jgi:hypothetical protein
MAIRSRLELAALYRPGTHQGDGIGVTERWTWDFVVDGHRLSAAIRGDVAGALGWGDVVWETSVTDKLLRRAEPDLPPDRVALYVCPECGDLGCGAATASVSVDDREVVWRDFRWERDWEGASDDDAFPIGPFHFDRHAYQQLLMAARSVRPGPGVAPLTAS